MRNVIWFWCCFFVGVMCGCGCIVGICLGNKFSGVFRVVGSVGVSGFVNCLIWVVMLNSLGVGSVFRIV